MSFNYDKINVYNLRNKLFLIYILNVTDIIFTLILLKTGSFYRANSLIRVLMSNSLLSLFIKLVVPLLLIHIIIKAIKKASYRQLYFSNIVANIFLGLFIAVNLFHSFCTGVYVII